MGKLVNSGQGVTNSLPSSRQNMGRPKAAAVSLLLLASLGMGFLGGLVATNKNDSLDNSKTNQQVVLRESELISDIAKTVGPSVVSVNVTGEAAPIDSFFGFGGEAFQRESAGTGFIISKDGVIITNRHVVPSGTSKVSITMSDGTVLEDVSVVGRTRDNDSLDVAFLKINDKKGKDLTVAKIGDSSKVQVGDKVVAIGNALGQFQNTVTSGIISGYGRDIQALGGSGRGSETLQNLFQTDTAINQGNSGGPLVNINGEVIGINTAIAGGDAQNIGFAIPINDIQGLIKSVLEKGKLLRPYLGVRYVTLTDDYAYQFNLNTKRGAYIAPPGNSGQPSVLPNSPASKAGLKEKDIIVMINEYKIDQSSSLTSVLGRYSVGDSVTLTIVRDGKEQTLKATLEAAPTD